MLSRLFEALTNARNALYNRDILASYSAGVPVVSIGNITVGGTGKTPLVALTAKILADDGEKVCIISRGYGRASPKNRVLVSDGEQVIAAASDAGDEPFELANKLLSEAVVIADADRTAAAKWARDRFGATVFVLDDAFQHRRIRRDLDIVTIDATNPFGNGKTLPFGILRESMKNLRRADAIVITRTNLAKNIEELKRQIADYNPDCSIFAAENKIVNLTNLKDYPAAKIEHTTDEEQKTLAKDKNLAFCALGNPNNFFEQLRRESFDLVSTKVFRDHHLYTQKDIESIEARARKDGIGILLTTAKDAAKLSALKFTLPCFIVEVKTVLDDDAGFRRLLMKTLINRDRS